MVMWLVVSILLAVDMCVLLYMTLDETRAMAAARQWLQRSTIAAYAEAAAGLDFHLGSTETPGKSARSALLGFGERGNCVIFIPDSENFLWLVRSRSPGWKVAFWSGEGGGSFSPEIPDVSCDELANKPVSLTAVLRRRVLENHRRQSHTELTVEAFRRELVIRGRQLGAGTEGNRREAANAPSFSSSSSSSYSYIGRLSLCVVSTLGGDLEIFIHSGGAEGRTRLRVEGASGFTGDFRRFPLQVRDGESCAMAAVILRRHAESLRHLLRILRRATTVQYVSTAVEYRQTFPDVGELRLERELFLDAEQKAQLQCAAQEGGSEQQLEKLRELGGELNFSRLGSSKLANRLVPEIADLFVPALCVQLRHGRPEFRAAGSGGDFAMTAGAVWLALVT